MKNSRVIYTLVFILILLILFMNRPSSYYEGKPSTTLPVFTKATVQMIIDQDTMYRKEFFSSSSTWSRGTRTPMPLIYLKILNRLLTLSDTQFEKINSVASKIQDLQNASNRDNIILVKLLLAGDISGFVNFFTDPLPPTITIKMIANVASNFLAPDTSVYNKQNIDLILSDPLLSDPRSGFPPQFKSNLNILRNLTDQQIVTVGYLVENDQLIQPGELLNNISSPQFPSFLNNVSTIKQSGTSITREYILSNMPIKSQPTMMPSKPSMMPAKPSMMPSKPYIKPPPVLMKSSSFIRYNSFK